jgi:DNA polymerase III sliding clamp (beta) subunit (PCNA family)
LQDPVFNGCPGCALLPERLLLLVEGKELRAVATDGHRLAYASVEIEGDLPRQELILPRKTVLEVEPPAFR